MKIKRSLFRWYSQRLWVITLPALLLVLLDVFIFQREPYSGQKLLTWLGFILCHNGSLEWRLGTLNNSTDAFIYTRGFSRDTLFWHRSLAGAAHVLLVWGTISLAIWTGLRSWVQDHIFQNPEFPMMDGLDNWMPIAWLSLYVVLISLHRYFGIRVRQPIRGTMGVVYFGMGLFPTFLIILDLAGQRIEWTIFLLIAGGAITVAASLWGAWRLHRTMEIKS